MTIEKKCFISAEDILAIQYECAKCRVKTTIPLLGETTRWPFSCPTCGTDWLGGGTNETEIITKFVSSLKQLAGAVKGRAFRFSLEIQCEEKDQED